MGTLLRDRWLPVGIVVLLVALVGFEIAALADDDGTGAPEAPRAATRVARDFAVAITSFDHKRIDADVERILSFGDERLERDFRAAMGDGFVEGVERNKRVAVGRVLYGPTVQRVADGSAAFVVVVGQRIVSEAKTDDPPQSLTVSMLVTVTTDDDPIVVEAEVI